MKIKWNWKKILETYSNFYIHMMTGFDGVSLGGDD